MERCEVGRSGIIDGNVKTGQIGAARGEALESVKAAHERKIERQPSRAGQSITQGRHRRALRGEWLAAGRCEPCSASALQLDQRRAELERVIAQQPPRGAIRK